MFCVGTKVVLVFLSLLRLRIIYFYYSQIHCFGLIFLIIKCVFVGQALVLGWQEY